MMPYRQRLFVLATLFLGLWCTDTAVARELVQVGASGGTRGNVTLTREAAGIVEKQIQSGETIYLGDVIKSDRSSGVQILTMGGSVLSFGPVGEYSIESFVSGKFLCTETGEFLGRGQNELIALRRCDPARAGKVSVRVQKGNFEYTSNGGNCDESPTLTLYLPTATVRSFGEHVVVAVRGEAGPNAAADVAFGRLTEVSKWMEKARYVVVLPETKYRRNKTCGTIAVTPVSSARANRKTIPKGANSVDRSILSVRGTAVFGYDDGKVSAPISVRLRY